MGAMDIILAFPSIILAIAITTILGPSITNLMIAVGIVYIPQYARLARSSVLGVKETEYVEAARAIGAGVPSAAIELESKSATTNSSPVSLYLYKKLAILHMVYSLLHPSQMPLDGHTNDRRPQRFQRRLDHSASIPAIPFYQPRN